MLHHQSLAAILVSCGMAQGGRTGERMKMVAAKAGNYTPVVDQIDSVIDPMECLFSVYFKH